MSPQPYSGSPEELRVFKDKFIDHVSLMDGHRATLETIKLDFGVQVKENSSTGTAIQRVLGDAIYAGNELRAILFDAAFALGATAADVEAMDELNAQDLRSGNFNYDFT
ncbi:hypothetical protein [Nocardia sp. NPDC003963]